MRLSKDDIFLICTKLSLKDLLNFSLCSKYIYSVFISRIWLHKLKEEYPEFEKCEFLEYRELYKDLYKIIEENVYEIYSLSRPKFIEDEKTLVSNVKRLLFIYDQFDEKEKRCYYVYLIFAWLDKNLWFLHKREKFRLTSQQKLRDLSNDEIGNKIFKDFSHLLNL